MRKATGLEDKEEKSLKNVARNPRVARRPAAPTKALILAHEVHHAD